MAKDTLNDDVDEEAGTSPSDVQCVKATIADVRIIDKQQYVRELLSSGLAEYGKATQRCCYREEQRTEVAIVFVREESR